MNATLIESVLSSWEKNFNGDPLIVQSPGRINLIGEHTDYNEGYVFPAAIDKYIVVAIQTTNRPDCRIISLDSNRELEFSLADPPFRFPHGSWENYVIGVAMEVMEAGYGIDGFKMVFAGDIPQGAGLSSSAALENAVVFGLNAVFDLGIPKEQMIMISQAAEHNYAGVQCGIMDQFASMFGKVDYGLLLDCRSVRALEKELYFDDCELLLVNSNVQHTLAESAYNDRLDECQTGVAILQEYYPDLKALRDINQHQLEQVAELFPPLIYDRCTYIAKENARVLQSVIAFQQGDMDAFGVILSDAHNDMRFLYEITCPEIDFIVDMANNHEDLLGCRMIGGGFGGCTLNLIRKGSADDIFNDTFREAYRKRFNLELDLYPVTISDGTKLINY